MTSPDYHVPDGLERPSMLAAAAFLVVLTVTILELATEAGSAATWRSLVYPVLTVFAGEVWHRMVREEREYRRQWAEAYRRPDWRR